MYMYIHLICEQVTKKIHTAAKQHKAALAKNMCRCIFPVICDPTHYQVNLNDLHYKCVCYMCQEPMTLALMNS